MKRAAALSVICLWPIAASAAEYTSVYTTFDLDTCKVIEKGDDPLYGGTWACKGMKGIDILQAVDDDRTFVAFGGQAKTHCAFQKTFFSFNTALSPVEWRLKDGVPFAAIERWSVVIDENGKSITWLVVNALKKNDSCHAHYVAGSYPNANEHVRRAADDLAEDFNCENDAPTVDSKTGPPPIDILACKDMSTD